jgi:cell wall-associated NlpC family hydrolase
MGVRPRSVVLVVAVAAAVLIPAQSALAFSDVPTSYWDYTAIQYVANSNAWMADFGTSTFKPKTLEMRKYLARSLVKMYAPGEADDTGITFADIPKSDYWYHWANIASKHGWMPKYDSGKWLPDGSARESVFDRALVMAMGIKDPATGLANIHQDDGDRYTVSDVFPYLVIARALDLHYNHSTESEDIVSTDYIPRDEVAYSLWKADNVASWQISDLSRFDDISLPALDPSSSPTVAQKQALTQYALTQVGYPYIWAGEWHSVTPSGYCCGYQPKGGFDCSGFAWWTLKKNEDGYNAAQFHSPYAGWTVHERSSALMAEYTKAPISFAGLKIGDLMFFASNGGKTWQDVDHVGIYLGNSWMIHSTGISDGPVLEWVADGWYHDHFVFGRRLIGAGSSPSHGTEDIATAGDRF